MSQILQVVDGEASESDSEIEIAKTLDCDPINPEAFVIAGEAPESDDEQKKSQPMEQDDPLATLPDLPLYTVIEPSAPTIYNSILHQKLWEANISFRANLDGLVRSTTDISVEKLTSADKTLLNVQESMRAINANLTLARARIKQLREQLEKANCSSALPAVKINTTS